MKLKKFKRTQIGATRQIHCRLQIRMNTASTNICRAEGVGFEPTVPLQARLISSQVHSTTLPPFQLSYPQRFTTRLIKLDCLRELLCPKIWQNPRRNPAMLVS